MTQPELYELMARFERSGLHSLKLTVPDCSVELVRAEGPACVPGAAPGSSGIIPVYVPSSCPSFPGALRTASASRGCPLASPRFTGTMLGRIVHRPFSRRRLPGPFPGRRVL